jgi:hypothetical protein
MKQIYTQYFQKSKVFLYPLLGVAKGIRYVPIQTYTSWDGNHVGNENLLICVYKIEQDSKKTFNKFLKEHLQKNELFHSNSSSDNLEIVTFNLSFFKGDLRKFEQGKYSEFSIMTKKIIMDFFGNTGTISEYMESYLYPEKYYEVYSEILNVPITLLEEVIELCDKPNMKKEHFKKSIVELELFK